jgi:hypothetical protein
VKTSKKTKRFEKRRTLGKVGVIEGGEIQNQWQVRGLAQMLNVPIRTRFSRGLVRVSEDGRQIFWVLCGVAFGGESELRLLEPGSFLFVTFYNLTPTDSTNLTPTDSTTTKKSVTSKPQISQMTQIRKFERPRKFLISGYRAALGPEHRSLK